MDFDDMAMLESAFQFIEECNPTASSPSASSDSPVSSSSDSGYASSGVQDADAIVASVRGFLDDLDSHDLGATDLQSERNNKTSSHRTLTICRGRPYSNSSAIRRRRRTAAQELKLLQLQVHELSGKLESLQLNAREQAMNGCPRRNASLSFWGNAVARQNEYRMIAERENQRLRAVVAAQTRRTKQLQWVIHKLTDTSETSQVIGSQIDCADPVIPPDPPAMLALLLTEAHDIYTNIDKFLVSGLSRQSFFSHSEMQIVPFGRHIVDRALWRGLGYRVTRQTSNFYRDRVNVTDSIMSTCAHIVIPQQNGDGLYIQMRLSGRKYRETDRTVYVLCALVEPKDLKGRLPLGPAFRETHVRVVTANEHLSGTNMTDGDSTTIDTRMEVARNVGDAWDDHLARSMWKQAIQARKVVIEDLLVEEASKMGA